MLVTISSSGNSPNIISALHAAVQLGLVTVTISGMDGNNRSRRMGLLNFYVPATRYGLVEASHQVILHCWLDCYMDHFVSGKL
jgi:D-sedoheptulose 7-phosphate isomerase